MLGDEVAEEPTAETLEGYVRSAARPARGGAPSRHRRLAGHRAAADAARPRASARARDRRRRKLRQKPEAILGRALRPDEALLLAEVESRGSVDEAVKALVETRPPALLDRYRAQAFPTQSLGTRIKIVLAGPLANILFAPILMTIVFMYGVPYVKPVWVRSRQGMPAYAGGPAQGRSDSSRSMEQKIENWADLSDAIKAGNGAPIKIDFARPAPNASPSTMSLLVTAAAEKEDTGYGNKTSVWIIGVLPRGDEGIKRYGPFKAMYQSVVSTADLSGRLVMGIALIINGTTPARQALGGPIMIAKMAGKEAKQGFADVARLHGDAEPGAGHHQPAAGAVARRRPSVLFPDRRLARQTAAAAASRVRDADRAAAAGGADDFRHR